MAPTGCTDKNMSETNERSYITSKEPFTTATSNEGRDTASPYFAITIKPLSKSKTYYQEDLEKFIRKNIWPYYDFSDITYEVDKKGVLHAHMLATGTPHTGKHKRIRYWTQDIQQLDPLGLMKWMNYLKKDSKCKDSQEQVLWSHIASTQCLFD